MSLKEKVELVVILWGSPWTCHDWIL